MSKSLKDQIEPRNGHTFESLTKMWEDGHIAYAQLQSENHLLTAQMAVMVESLSEIKNLVKSDDSITATKIEVQVLNGLSNSTAAKDLLERVKRMEMLLTDVLTWYDRDGSVGGASDVIENLRQDLSTTQPPAKE